MKFRLEKVTLTATNHPCGESSHNGAGHYADATVAQVREMHKAGMNTYDLMRELGIPRRTIRDWVAGSRRNIKITKTVVRRRYE